MRYKQANNQGQITPRNPQRDRKYTKQCQDQGLPNTQLERGGKLLNEPDDIPVTKATAVVFRISTQAHKHA